MSKPKFTQLLMLSLCVCALTVARAQTVSNIALTGSLSTSYVSSWENLNAVTSGHTPANSADKTGGAYGNWNGEANYNQWNWVQLDWSQARVIQSTDVYWWQDGAGIMQPSSAYVQYWNGSTWVNINSSNNNIGVALNQWNALSLSSFITTTRIRINFIGPRATGILEWRVMGTTAVSSANNVALTGTLSTSYVSPWENLNAVTSNHTPTSSSDKTGGAYGNWNGEANYNQWNWVQLDWSQPHEINSTDMYWWQDGGGIMQPSSAYVQYWNGSAWVNINNSNNNIGVALNQWNTLTLSSAVTTTRLRVNFIGPRATGILEWRVWGTGGPSNDDDGDPYTWPSYTPTISYNFKDEFPNLPQPTNVRNDCPQVVGTQSDRWWCFRWGPNKNSLVTSAAITPMLQRMNTDFQYFRDIMGWPPDKRAKEGYRSAIYLYGSGLCTDNASNTALGGWQSSISGYPMVLLSYYPVFSFDPACTFSDRFAQQSACVHEGIHSVLADLPGIKRAAWFHEGGNTWLQQEAYAIRDGTYGNMGNLNAATLIAPFMPIECYSGWLQDGSFGGPSAEGVNMFNGSQQICTWRNLLGGTQYSNIFPTFLGTWLGKGSVPWIWRYCPDRVLEGLYNGGGNVQGLGDAQTRRLICEFRARMALLDMKEWTASCRSLLNSNWMLEVRPEWQPSWKTIEECPVWIATPYAKTTNNGGVLTPEYRTTPGWSGSNQVPLTVSGNTVVVNFQPLGPNMTCQLVYRATDGSAVYGKIVSSGDCKLRLDKPPRHGVVIAVICNTDYIYGGEATRKAHHDYRLRLVSGVSGAADIYTKWYETNLNASSSRIALETSDWQQTTYASENVVFEPSTMPCAGAEYVKQAGKLTDAIQVFPNPMSVKNGILNFDLGELNSESAHVEIFDQDGQRILAAELSDEKRIGLNDGRLKAGIYHVHIRTLAGTKIIKLVAR